jgi:hypothetical protein
MASGKVIETVITTDVDGVIKGAEKVADSFEEIQDSLRDTAKAGDKAFEQVEDAAKEAAKAVGAEARNIDRDLTRALDDVADQARTTGRTVGREVSDGTDRAGEGFDDLRSEAASTATEAAASFGSIEDAAGALQEVVANAFAGFGPAGMAAGLIAAAGIGIAISALEDNAEAINDNKEKVIGMAQAIKDNGGVLRQSDYIQGMEDYGYSIVDTKEWLDIFQEDAITGFEEMSKLSKDSGIDLKTAFDGAFGSVKDAEKGLQIVNEKLTVLKDKKDAVYNTTGSILEPVEGEALTSLDELKTKMEDNIKNQRIAEEMEKARRAAIEGTVEATLEDIAALEKKNSLLQDGVTSELDYLDQVTETTKTIEENGRTLDKNTEAGRNNQRALIEQSDAALEMAQSQLTAGVSADTVAASLAGQREALLITLDAMTGNRAESERLAASLGLIPSEVITEVKTNGVAQSKTEIETIPATKDAQVNVTETGSAEVDARIQAVQGKEVKIDVDDMYTVSETQKRIDGIRGRDLVKVDVDDDYTVSEVQKRIDGIKGRDVYVNLKIGNEFEFQQAIARLTADASKTITINERGGTSVP